MYFTKYSVVNTTVNTHWNRGPDRKRDWGKWGMEEKSAKDCWEALFEIYNC